MSNHIVYCPRCDRSYSSETSVTFAMDKLISHVEGQHLDYPIENLGVDCSRPKHSLE